jgi:formate--tetrahydrofolate ligase
LAKDLGDLKERIGNILVGFTRKDNPIFARDFNICGAMTTVLKDAIKPNIVQTIEKTPAFVHSGPFANISFGTNSAVATRMALKLSDYVVTECGFGSDLGFEKFINLVSRFTGYKIHAVVLVATVRALRHQGQGSNHCDFCALKEGLANLGKHIDNIKYFGFKPIVAINVFKDDKKEDIDLIKSFCDDKGVVAEKSEAFSKGGDGSLKLAKEVAKATDKSKGDYKFVYNIDDSVEVKIEKIAKHIYGAEGVIFSWDAKKKIKLINKLGFHQLPICIAKTPLSFSDNKKKLNVPTGWRLNINDINIASGAGYLIPISGDIMLMPGLPKTPSAEKIDIDETGHNIIGLF